MNSIIALDIDQTLIKGHTGGRFDASNSELLAQLGSDERRYNILKALGELRKLGSIIVLITRGMYKNSRNLLNEFLLASKENTGFGPEDLNITVFGAMMTEQDLVNELHLVLDGNTSIPDTVVPLLKSLVNVKIEEPNWHVIKSQGFIRLIQQCFYDTRFVYFFDDTLENITTANRFENVCGYFISEYENQLISNLNSLSLHLNKENRKYVNVTDMFNGSVRNTYPYFDTNPPQLFLIFSKSKQRWFINTLKNPKSFNPITNYYANILGVPVPAPTAYPAPISSGQTGPGGAAAGTADGFMHKYLKYKSKYLDLLNKN